MAVANSGELGIMAWGSARVSPKQPFLKVHSLPVPLAHGRSSRSRGRARQHARRVRYPERDPTRTKDFLRHPCATFAAPA